jgi:hypothetical protein
MNPLPSLPKPKSVRASLDAIAGALAQSRWKAALNGLALAAIAWIVVIAALDAEYHLADRLRWLFLFALIGLGLPLAWFWLKRIRRSFPTATEIARRLDPDPSLLLAATERSPASNLDDPVAFALGEHAEVEARRRLATLVLPRPWLGAAIRNLLLFGLCAVLLVCVFEPVAATAAARALMPWRPISYTRIYLAPLPGEVPAGLAIQIEATVTGRRPSTATLYLRDPQASASWQTLALTISEAGSLTHRLDPLDDDLEFFIAAGDAQSEVIRVRPFRPATAQNLRITMTPPAYTGWPSLDISGGNATLLRGASIKWSLVPSSPLRSASIIFDAPKPAAPILFERQPDGSWSADFTPTASVPYHLQLTDERGRPGDPNLAFEIEVQPDAVPQVTLLSPSPTSNASPAATLRIEAEVIDETIVQQATVRVRKAGGGLDLTIPLQPAPNDATRLVGSLALATLQLRNGDGLTLQAEATDSNKGVGRSHLHVVAIGRQTPETAVADPFGVLEQQRDLLDQTSHLTRPRPDQTTSLAGRQRQAAELAKQLEQIATSQPQGAAMAEHARRARASMENAARLLDQVRPTEAAAHQEQALADLLRSLDTLAELNRLGLLDERKIAELIARHQTDRANANAALDQTLTSELAHLQSLTNSQRALIERLRNEAANLKPESDRRSQADIAARASDLANRLTRLASMHPEMDARFATAARQAAGSLDAASRQIESQPASAHRLQNHGLRQLEDLAAALAQRPKPSADPFKPEVLRDTAPPGYEDWIAEYFRALSRD